MLSSIDMQDIEQIIQSVTKRIVHDTPSQKTLAIIAEFTNTLNNHIKEEEEELRGTITSLTEIKEHLKRQDDTFHKFNEETRAHMARVEPVIKRFEEEKSFNAGVKELGKRAIFWSKVAGAIGVFIYAAKYAATHFLIR